MLTLVFALSLFGTSQAAGQPAHDDIVDVAVGAGQFNTLVAAVKAAGLVETLRGDGPFTVFAPTDEAFSKLPRGTVEQLLLPENRADLVALLTFHVVSGRIPSDKLLSTTSAKTVNGKSLPIGLRIGNASVIQADVSASNGVIHVIDSVLMPEMPTSTTAAARDLIRTAIDRGAPLFNMGQTAACAAVYEVTVKALLQLDADLPDSAERPLRRALNRVQTTHDATDRAWMLREGLDAAFAALSPRRMMTTAAGH
ncbi:MAG: transforming growth factor-beta-induced protein [Rhodothermales bacterium]|jgi:transforming growth factor-beta-induced protein